MAQMTESLARSLLNYAERDEHPPITAWETRQLLRFWLAHHERYAHRPAGYVQLDDLPHVAIDQDYLAANVAACTNLRAAQAKHYGDAVAEFQLGSRLGMLGAELAERQRPMDPEIAAIIYENRESLYE